MRRRIVAAIHRGRHADGPPAVGRFAQLTGDRDAREVLRTTPIVDAIPWPEGRSERAIDAAIDAEITSALDVMIARPREPQAVASALADLPTDAAVTDPYCPA